MIRLTSESEAIRILNQPATIQRLETVAEKMTVQPWLCEVNNHKMLFVFWCVEGMSFEVHIARDGEPSPLDRIMAKDIMDWVFSNGAEKIITNCPEGKISNMARKMGMTECGHVGNNLIFEVKSWV